MTTITKGWLGSFCCLNTVRKFVGDNAQILEILLRWVDVRQLFNSFAVETFPSPLAPWRSPSPRTTTTCSCSTSARTWSWATSRLCVRSRRVSRSIRSGSPTTDNCWWTTRVRWETWASATETSSSSRVSAAVAAAAAVQKRTARATVRHDTRCPLYDPIFHPVTYSFPQTFFRTSISAASKCPARPTVVRTLPGRTKCKTPNTSGTCSCPVPNSWRSWSKTIPGSLMLWFRTKLVSYVVVVGQRGVVNSVEGADLVANLDWTDLTQILNIVE